MVDAVKLLGATAKGPNYEVESPVASDGMLYVFHLDTPYGRYTVFGEQLLKLRLHELAALQQLENVSQGEVFTSSVASAVAKPVEAAGRVLANPISAVTGTMSGLGEALNRVGARLADPYAKRGNPVDGLIGTAAARRALAHEHNVDPYTTFPPLAARLDELAQASALGSAAVRGASMAVPGAVGLAIGGVRAAGSLGDLVKNKTVAELDEINEGDLLKMSIDPRVVQAFMANGNYTPTDKTFIVAALKSMPETEDKAAYLATIAQAGRPDLAFFHRLQAQWMAAYHAKVAPLEGFVSILGLAFVRRADGRLVGFFPVDAIAWTETVQKAVANLNAQAKAEKANGLELRITGTVTEQARQGFRKVGWRVYEKDTSLVEGQ